MFYVIDSSAEGAARVCPTTEHPPSLNIPLVLHIAPIHPGGPGQAFQVCHFHV